MASFTRKSEIGQVIWKTFTSFKFFTCMYVREGRFRSYFPKYVKHIFMSFFQKSLDTHFVRIKSKVTLIQIL